MDLADMAPAVLGAYRAKGFSHRDVFVQRLELMAWDARLTCC